MDLVRLIGRYIRRYTAWIVLAFLTIPLYGLATTGMVSLVEPLFAEVLQAGEQKPAFLGVSAADEEAGDASPGGVEELAARFNLKKISERGYQRLKLSLGIDDTEKEG